MLSIESTFVSDFFMFSLSNDFKEKKATSAPETIVFIAIVSNNKAR